MTRFFSSLFLGAVVSTFAFAQGPSNMSMVRVVHAVSDAPAVDVLANGNLVFQGLNFKDYSDYVAVPAGSYSFQVNLSGTNKTVITSSPNVLIPGGIYTFYAMGTVAKGTLQLVGAGDDITPPPPGTTKIRVVHGASTAPAVDVYVSAPFAPLGSPALTGVPFAAAGPYVTVPVGNYQGRVTPAGSKTVVIDSGRVSLTSGTVRTFLALDPSTPGGPFQLLVLNDVN